MEFKGKVIKIYEKRTGVSKSGKPWASIDLLIDAENRDEESISVTLFGEEHIQKNLPKEGQYIIAHLTTRSREFNGKPFNDVRAWKIELDNTRVQPQ